MVICVAKNDYRSGRRQVSFVVDEVLWLQVKAVAAAQGVSVTRLVTGLLEEAVDGDVGYRSDDHGPVAQARDFVRSLSGGDRGGDPVSSAVGRGTLESRDPLEEIA